MAQQGYGCPPDGGYGAGMPGMLGPQPGRPSLFGIPLPEMLVLPWAPPGIEPPWPRDEYLHDGGDNGAQVTVGPEFQVRGLELEDTVVHFDTTDGRRLVEPSNRVHIYAPRFAAVRSVEQTQESEQRKQISEASLPVRVAQSGERQFVTTSLQQVQPVGDVGVKLPSVARLEQAEAGFSSRDKAVGFQGAFKAYEDFAIMRLGSFDDLEKVRLAESVASAITWSSDQALQVVLDKQQAVVATGDQRAQATFRVDEPSNPKLRVIKVASTNQARPGDIVDFTIRFDNVGDSAIGNVTLIDNLTTRLEYVEGSSKSSRDGDFLTDPNQGESLMLRWEFTDPLEPGQGGLVRFQCRVR
jgi:uncharacterized repeat protein (TIGR01451 family)